MKQTERTKVAINSIKRAICIDPKYKEELFKNILDYYFHREYYEFYNYEFMEEVIEEINKLVISEKVIRQNQLVRELIVKAKDRK